MGKNLIEFLDTIRIIITVNSWTIVAEHVFRQEWISIAAGFSCGTLLEKLKSK